MDYFGDMPKRRAVGGRGTDQYNMAQRDPMVHEIKGQMGAERAMEGRGTSAQEYRKLQNASHAHMRGGAMAGGAPSMAGGRPQLAGGAMAGGRVVGAGMAGGGEDGMFTERQLKGLARAVGSGKPLGRTHAKMMASIKGAGFFDDFQKGFMSVIRPVAGVAKSFLPPVAQMGLSAIGLGMGGGSDSEDEVAVVGGRKKRAKAGPSDARRRRGAMVSKLMKEKGMSLGEASKYIKEHGMA
jgi:hypothetical protein